MPPKNNKKGSHTRPWQRFDSKASPRHSPDKEPFSRLADGTFTIEPIIFYEGNASLREFPDNLKADLYAYINTPGATTKTFAGPTKNYDLHTTSKGEPACFVELGTTITLKAATFRFGPVLNRRQMVVVCPAPDSSFNNGNPAIIIYYGKGNNSDGRKISSRWAIWTPTGFRNDLLVDRLITGDASVSSDNVEGTIIKQKKRKWTKRSRAKPFSDVTKANDEDKGDGVGDDVGGGVNDTVGEGVDGTVSDDVDDSNDSDYQESSASDLIENKRRRTIHVFPQHKQIDKQQSTRHSFPQPGFVNINTNDAEFSAEGRRSGFINVVDFSAPEDEARTDFQSRRSSVQSRIGFRQQNKTEDNAIQPTNQYLPFNSTTVSGVYPLTASATTTVSHRGILPSPSTPITSISSITNPRQPQNETGKVVFEFKLSRDGNAHLSKSQRQCNSVQKLFAYAKKAGISNTETTILSASTVSGSVDVVRDDDDDFNDLSYLIESEVGSTGGDSVVTVTVVPCAF